MELDPGEDLRTGPRGLRKIALALLVVALATGGIATQMTDIGHFTGFAALAVMFVLASLFLLWQSRR